MGALHDWLHHGGNIAAAQAHFGQDAADWIDLSTGINPAPWSGAANITIDWRALPAPGALAALERVAAAHFGASPAYVCAVPGSEMALRLLPLLGLPHDALIASPAYRTYADAFDGARSASRDAVLAHAGHAGTLVIANPNNPDGQTSPAETLHRLAETQAARGGWLIVDEAFGDCMPELSAAPLVRAGLPLIVTRSFGKFFGLAGLRLGFVIAPPTLIARLRALVGSWPVSAGAVAIGAAAYADAAWIATTRESLKTQTDRLDSVLRRHGLSPHGGCPLFRLVETAEAAALFERLARAAILTRPFDYAPHWLRIGLPGGMEALDRLDRALGDG